MVSDRPCYLAWFNHLEEFFINFDGQLDRVILSAVMHRPLSKDKLVNESEGHDESSRFYPIDGDYFVLRYSEAITLNVEYIKLNTTIKPSETSRDIDLTG